MFALMYAMVDSLPYVYLNVMAGLMAAPMVVIELALMGAMYRSRKLNLAIMAVSVLLGVGCWTFIRQQTAVADSQFLKSMIPHRAAAILMCKEAALGDPRVKELCENIVSNQQSEIVQMKAMLAEREE